MSKELIEQIKSMKLHEEIQVTESCHLLRIMGGWVYDFGACAVPVKESEMNGMSFDEMLSIARGETLEDS